MPDENENIDEKLLTIGVIYYRELKCSNIIRVIGLLTDEDEEEAKRYLKMLKENNKNSQQSKNYKMCIINNVNLMD